MEEEPKSLPVGSRDFERRTYNVVSWYNSNPKWSNHFCLYCGRKVGPDSAIPSNKEHLIGREFVPTGYLEGPAFNFIFRACVECNSDKSKMEGHVSALTLANSAGPLHSEEVNALAARKASKEFHPLKKGVLVRDAGAELKESFPVGFGTLDMNLVGPPPFEDAQVYDLAGHHIQALFALTFCEDPRSSSDPSLLPHTHLQFYDYFTVDDWGNPRLQELIRRTSNWVENFWADSARGYYRASLRRSPNAEEDFLFWALEWNKQLRVVGTVAPPDLKTGLFDNLPQERWFRAQAGGRMRIQHPLQGGTDELFLRGSSKANTVTDGVPSPSGEEDKES